MRYLKNITLFWGLQTQIVFQDYNTDRKKLLFSAIISCKIKLFIIFSKIACKENKC